MRKTMMLAALAAAVGGPAWAQWAAIPPDQEEFCAVIQGAWRSFVDAGRERNATTNGIIRAELDAELEAIQRRRDQAIHGLITEGRGAVRGWIGVVQAVSPLRGASDSPPRILVTLRNACLSEGTITAVVPASAEWTAALRALQAGDRVRISGAFRPQSGRESSPPEARWEGSFLRNAAMGRPTYSVTLRTIEPAPLR